MLAKFYRIQRVVLLLLARSSLLLLGYLLDKLRVQVPLALERRCSLGAGRGRQVVEQEAPGLGASAAAIRNAWTKKVRSTPHFSWLSLTCEGELPELVQADFVLAEECVEGPEARLVVFRHDRRATINSLIGSSVALQEGHFGHTCNVRHSIDSKSVTNANGKTSPLITKTAKVSIKFFSIN